MHVFITSHKNKPQGVHKVIFIRLHHMSCQNVINHFPFKISCVCFNQEHWFCLMFYLIDFTLLILLSQHFLSVCVHLLVLRTVKCMLLWKLCTHYFCQWIMSKINIETTHAHKKFCNNIWLSAKRCANGGSDFWLSIKSVSNTLSCCCFVCAFIIGQYHSGNNMSSKSRAAGEILFFESEKRHETLLQSLWYVTVSGTNVLFYCQMSG